MFGSKGLEQQARIQRGSSCSYINVFMTKVFFFVLLSSFLDPPLSRRSIRGKFTDLEIQIKQTKEALISRSN